MQRTLPLPATQSRHPFRRTVTTLRIEQARDRDDNDVKLFALSFAAFFVCFYTFIF